MWEVQIVYISIGIDACTMCCTYISARNHLNSYTAPVPAPSISEVTCEYWQVLGFVVCIGMYGGMYCGTYWYVLTWYVLWHVLLCIIFGMYYMY